MTPEAYQAGAILMAGLALWMAIRAARFSRCDRCWPHCPRDAHRTDVISSIVACALYLGAAAFFVVAEWAEVMSR